MDVCVKYFGALRDQLGTDQEMVPLAQPCRVADVVRSLEQRHPALATWRDRLLVAVNLDYADPETPVGDRDELALMPPVQGG